MTIKNLYQSVTNTTKPLSIAITDSHQQGTSVAVIEAESTTLSIGDSVTIDMGYTTNHDVLFTGYVKMIETKVPNNIVIITAHDVLSRAVDYFLASANPDNPYTVYRIAAEDLVEALLNKAGLTNYTADPTNFIFAWTHSAEINLVGIYDYCRQLAETLAWHLWADENGLIHFEDRKPYVMGGDSSVATLTDADIIHFVEGQSDRDLRNRVVVYGWSGIYAESHASSPYLPAGFYKTTVVSSTIIDRQSEANDAADYNLTAFNRLTEYAQATVEGNPLYKARSVITVNQTNLGISNQDYYIFTARHAMSQSGYVCELELRK